MSITTWDYAAEEDDARRDAERLYDERQMQYGANVPSAREIREERKQ